MKRLLHTLQFLLIGSILLSLALATQPAHAGGVVGTGSAASCTEAAFNTALAAGGLVTFNCGAAPVTIILTAQKTISIDTTLDGGATITLSGNNLVRHFVVNAGKSLTLNRITLASGVHPNGGSIYSQGVLVVTNSTFSNNSSNGTYGGAILSEAAGVATITSTTFTNNVSGAAFAGAIENRGSMTIRSGAFNNNLGGMLAGAINNSGTLEVTDTSFDHNRGDHAGAINNNGSLAIGHSLFTYNSTLNGFAGAIYNDTTSPVTITDSTFIGNTAKNAGAVYNTRSTMTITGSLFNANTVASVTSTAEGGAIYGDLTGTINLKTSTLSGNLATLGNGAGIFNNGVLNVTADTFTANIASTDGIKGGRGGGIYSTLGSTLTVVNSTFSGNEAYYGGGGILTYADSAVTNSTIYGNNGGGLVHSGTTTASVKNTILANNLVYGNPNNCWSTLITSLGHNIDSANTCSFTQPGDLVNTNPLLGPLANNGGPTLTLFLLPGSPAINTGTNTGCPAADQRGVKRPLFGTCDIGAVEAGWQVLLPLQFRP